MKFKGYELIKDINVLAIGTIIKSEDGKIYILNKKEDGTRTFSRKDGTNRRFCCYTSLQKEYEILEDKTEEIEEIKTKGVFDYGELLGLYELKINELARAINQIKKDMQVYTSKETNCMSE